MKHVRLLATGGTIAARSDSKIDLNNYVSGSLTGQELLDVLPELQKLAVISVEEIANIDSADLGFAHWRQLVGQIREAFRVNHELAGVVVTHGTNTLEETAWLLQLLIDDPRPVVLVGAMRPATSLSADGPLNLFQAIQTAIAPCARGHGVLVVMDGEIHTARSVSKIATQGVGAFRSIAPGPIGWVDDSGVHLPLRYNIIKSNNNPFINIDLPEKWPQVVILYGCVEPSTVIIPTLLSLGIKGLVFTGTGAGQLSEFEWAALKAWDGPLPLMIRANRCGSGMVQRCKDNPDIGILSAGTLSPQKARVLLILALIAGLSRLELALLIEEIFSAHQID